MSQLRLLEKKIQRQLDILDYFLDHGKEISFVQIQADLSVTKPTLLTDIENINQQDERFNIQVEAQSINIEEYSYEMIQLIGKKLLRKSPTVMFLYYLLHEELNINSMSKKLFVSHMTTHRMIKQMNQYFTSQSLAMEIQVDKIITIKGNENQIRKFYRYLLTEVFLTDLYHEHHYFFKEFHRLTRKITGEKDNYDSFSIDLCAYVSFCRLSQGNQLYEGKEITTEVIQQGKLVEMNIEEMTGLKVQIEQSFNLVLTESVYQQLFPVNLIPIHHKEYQEGMMARIELTDRYLKITEIIQGYSKHYGITMKGIKKFPWAIYKRTFLLSEFNFFQINAHKISYNELLSVNKEKTLFLVDQIRGVGLFDESNPSLIYELITIIILKNQIIRRDFFKIHRKKVKILLYSSYHVTIAEMFESLIYDKYSSYIHIQVVKRNLLIENFHPERYDLILSDIDLGEDKGKSMLMPLVPTSSFWKEFENKLYQ